MVDWHTQSMAWLMDWIYPRNCLGCGQEGSFCCDACIKNKIIMKNNQVCPDCRVNSRKGSLCSKCKMKWQIDGLLVSIETNDLIKKLVHAYKYQDLFSLDQMMAHWLALNVTEDYNLVTSVPLNWRRQWWRGYNQAERMGRCLAKLINLPYRNCLKRKINTQSQVELRKMERRENVKDAFEPIYLNIIGEKVLIVDDVCTTMSTLNECAKALKKGGARTVRGIVLARGI